MGETPTVFLACMIPTLAIVAVAAERELGVFAGIKGRLVNVVRAFLRRKQRHVHDWDYGPPSLSGWAIVRCRTCPDWDIY